MTDFRALCAELTHELSGYSSADPYHDSDALIARARAALAEPVPKDDVALLREALAATAAQRRAEDDARAALAESATSDYKVASEDTMRRIRSTTKRWRINVIISTNDSSIDTRIGCGIWKCLDIEREILESVSLPEYLPAIKETTNG